MKTMIKSITPREDKKPWKCVLSHDGKEYASFDDVVYSGLTVGKWIDAKTSVKVTERGGKTYENLMLDGWDGIEAPSAGEVPDMAGEKDRAIAMESALSSAAQYMQAVAVANPEAVTASNWLAAARAAYGLVQNARTGEQEG